MAGIVMRLSLLVDLHRGIEAHSHGSLWVGSESIIMPCTYVQSLL